MGRRQGAGKEEGGTGQVEAGPSEAEQPARVQPFEVEKTGSLALLQEEEELAGLQEEELAGCSSSYGRQGLEQLEQAARMGTA